MNKLQKIREKIEIVVNRRLNLLNGDYFDLNEETDGLTNEIMDIINPLQEEPVSKDFEKKFISFVNATHDNNGSYSLHDFAQRLYNIAKEELKESVSEDFEEALAAEWKGYNDRGAATFDALEDNTQELAFAKGFYRGAKWKKQKDSIVNEELEEAADNALSNVLNTHEIVNVRSCLEMFRFGSKWKEQRMMANAIDAEVLENYDGKVIKYDETILDKKLSNCKVFDKVKVIVIKEE